MNTNIDFSTKTFDTQQALEKIAADTGTAIIEELASMAYFTQAQALIVQGEQNLKATRSELIVAQQAYGATEAVVEQAEAAVRKARADRELIPLGNEAERGKASTAIDQATYQLDSHQSQREAAHRRVVSAENTIANFEELLDALRQVEKPSTPHLAAVLKATK